MRNGSGQKKTVLRNFKNFIKTSAGGDAVGLITTYISSNEGKSSCKDWVFKTKYIKNLVKTLRNAYEKAESFHKRQWLSVVRAAGFTSTDLHRFGWKFTKKAWKSAGLHSICSYPGANVKENRGRCALSQDMVQRIKKHVLSDSMSRPASNRTMKITNSSSGDAERVVVRFKNFSDGDAYNIWKEQEEEQKRGICSESSFRKILKTIPHLKKARKETDKCEICVEGKKNELKLNEILRKSNRRRLITLKDRDERQKLRGYIELYEKHKSDNVHQRSSFKTMKETLPENEALLVMDFKANIVLNEDAAVQISKEYFQNSQISLFGIVLYYVKKGKLKQFYYDVFSDCTSHNSYFVSKALDRIFVDPFFTKKQFKSATFWLDNGPNHFKTREMFYYFYGIPDNNPTMDKVAWNFFVEYHGKNICDVRFSQIKAMLDAYVKNPHNPRLVSTEQVVSVVKKCQEKRNNVQKTKNLPYVKSAQILLDIPDMPKEREVLNISDFRHYYSFSRVGNEVQASILTGKRVVANWPAKTTQKKDTGKLKMQNSNISKFILSIRQHQTRYSCIPNIANLASSRNSEGKEGQGH